MSLPGRLHRICSFSASLVELGAIGNYISSGPQLSFSAEKAPYCTFYIELTCGESYIFKFFCRTFS